MESINESITFYNIIEKHKNELNCGSGKLCISPFLLSHINEALDHLRNSGGSTHLEISYELKVILYELENILKAISKLKLVQRNVATFSGPCDLRQCSSLKDAEFFRISLDNIQGLDSESNTINCISCSRCINVFDLFASNVWQNLKILSLSYCHLNKIEAECFKYIKTIEHLSLSFNNLKSIKGIDSLTKLLSLDISYNYLEEIPFFSEDSNRCLVEFYISHNNISSLQGIKELINLTHLDASDNCIYEKEILVELYSLKHLKWLKLCNNPLSLRQHYRMYVSHFLGSIKPPYQFILDDVPLRDAELDFMGSSKGIAPRIHRPSQPSLPRPQPEVNINSEVIHQTKGILKSSNRKARKGREVIIVDAVGDPTKTPAAHKPRKIGVVIHESVSLDNDAMTSSQNLNDDNKVNETPKIDNKHLEPEIKSPDMSASQNEIGIQNQLLKQNDMLHEKIIKKSYQGEMHSSPESTKTECHTVKVTVHASQDDELSKSIDDLPEETQPNENENVSNNNSKTIDIDDIRILESIDLILQKDMNQTNASNTDSTDEYLDATSNGNDELNNTMYISADNVNNNNKVSFTENEKSNVSNETKEQSSSDDSGSDDDLTGEENLWHVQKIVENSKPVNMFLVLLDCEIRERSTISGRTIATYPLAFVQSCAQISDDPITVELIFSSLLKHTTVRTYVMEFADAQTLMNKINVFLESRPDVVDAELTSFLCKSCNAFFSVFKTQARTLCTVCGSALVTEMEPVKPASAVEPLSNSSSQSSVVSSSLGGTETKTSPNNFTNPSSVSTVSSEPSEKCPEIFVSTPQKYESDVEIISNPSQSSIEVLDDKGTPSRKRSSEERHVIISPTLSTLVEVINGNLSTISEPSKVTSNLDVEITDDTTSQPLTDECDNLGSSLPDQDGSKDVTHLQMMTESSSSGSVMTSYEASGAVSNLPLSSTSADILETCVEPSASSDEPSDNNSSILNTSTESVKQNPADIYSYTNFTDVDHRIKAFLYQYVFNDDSEELSLFVRCHIWKTGGHDYPGCFVLSNKKVYIVMHTSTDYGLDASDWLKLRESYDLKSMKKVYPLIWNLGVGVQINRLNYFILLFDKSFTDNLLSHFKGLSLKGCDIGSKSSSKIALNLQQVVLTSIYVQVESIIDPTILLYTVCLKINILKDDEIQETMALGGFVMTANEFYVVLGDLIWLAGSGTPSIHFFQTMSSLIEIGQKDNIMSLHFLDEAEAVEVVWLLHCCSSAQVTSIISAMQSSLISVFSETQFNHLNSVT